MFKCFLTLADKLESIIRSKTQITNLLKAIVFIALVLVVYRQIASQGSIADIWKIFLANLSWDKIYLLVICVLLMPTNWYLESLKWKTALSSFIVIPIRSALKAILAGLTVGIITPQRIGEYGGRILVLEAKDNWKGVIATFICSIAQNLVNVLMGFLALLVYSLVLRQDLQAYSGWFIALSILILLVLIICFFNLKYIGVLLGRISWKRLQYYLDQLKAIKQVPKRINMKVLGVSVIRYIIYTIQYLLLLSFFGVEIGLLEGFAGIGMIFLIQTGIPLPPVLGIAARGEIALLIWGVHSTNSLGILAATFALWIINLVFPAIMGMIFVFNTNILRSLGYEK